MALTSDEKEHLALNLGFGILHSLELHNLDAEVQWPDDPTGRLGAQLVMGGVCGLDPNIGQQLERFLQDRP